MICWMWAVPLSQREPEGHRMGVAAPGKGFVCAEAGGFSIC